MTTIPSPADIARIRESARHTDGTFGEHARTAPEVRLAGGRCRARDLDAWLGSASRFTIDGILHSRRNGPDRFMTLQFSTDPDHLEQMRKLSDREGIQGVAVKDPSAGRNVSRYPSDRVLEVHVFFEGQHEKCFVSPARLVELTHAWFTSGQDEPLVTTETEEDSPHTQANYARMNPFSNRYRDNRTRPSGMKDYATWWKEPTGERGLGFMDGDSVVVTETGFDLLEMKNGHGPLEDRMKTGQRMTLEAWGKLDGCRAFAVDENGDSDATDIVEFSGGRGISYETTLGEFRDTLVEDTGLYTG